MKFGGWYYSQPFYKLEKLIADFKTLSDEEQDQKAFDYFLNNIYNGTTNNP